MPSEFGYSGKILMVDLSSGRFTTLPTAAYAKKYIGGRGIAARIYRDEVPPEASALDPKNLLIFITGPLAGLPGLSGSRWEICGKSPATDPEHFSWSNLGGSWGAQLKFAGYDGLVVAGQSEKPVYLLLADGTARLEDASGLWGNNSIDVRDAIKNKHGNSVRVVATGPAGENLVSFASVLAENDASGSGFGAVMGVKKLKAVAVKGGEHRPAVAHTEQLQNLRQYLFSLQPGKELLLRHWPHWPEHDRGITQQLCYGCISGCHRVTYAAEGGDKGKFFCQSAGFYRRLALGYYGEPNEVPFRASQICNKFGLDTKAMANIIKWLSGCYNAGILDDEKAGIPLSKIGSLEFIETLARKISLREGFGEVLADGIRPAADSLGEPFRQTVEDDLYVPGQTAGYYDGRQYLTHGLFYATEPREPVAHLHKTVNLIMLWLRWMQGREGAYMSSDMIRTIAKRFWGSELAADFSTWKGKALAAKYIQDREYANSSLVLCELSYPVMHIAHSDDHIGDPAIESRLYSAVTGNEVDEAGFCEIGERIFNLQRLVHLREGKNGRADDYPARFNFTVPLEADSLNPECLVPGKDGKPVSRKGATVDRQEYDNMLDEYYRLRGWDAATGKPTQEKLRQLQFNAIEIT
ncbi:aldehyde ferredoxin oxidoreductase N-terminal domain-containing protein [Chloroflexota bacterium]